MAVASERINTRAGRLIVIVATMLVLGWVAPVAAHKGHAGSEVTFVEEKEALRAMLPEGAQISRRKQAPGAAAIAWARAEHAMDITDTVKEFYLARDRDSGAVLGGAIVVGFPYRHGDARLALGMDATQRISKVALLSVNEKYVVDFENTVGTGYVSRYTMVSLRQLLMIANTEMQKGQPDSMFADQLRQAAVVLAALLKSVE